jgi:predicted nucleotidyltransferase
MKTLDAIEMLPNERASILEAARSLKADLPVTRVVLFGSRARGTANMDSDIDLLVLTSCPVTGQLRASVSDKLADINLKNDVMLSCIVVWESDWTEGLVRHTLIHSEVEREGCEIWSNQKLVNR